MTTRPAKAEKAKLEVTPTDASETPVVAKAAKAAPKAKAAKTKAKAKPADKSAAKVVAKGGAKAKKSEAPASTADEPANDVDDDAEAGASPTTTKGAGKKITLLIVESPAKAKTIQKYLGRSYVVLASKGHIKDLPKRGGVDIENGFKEEYVVIEEKGK